MMLQVSLSQLSPVGRRQDSPLLSPKGCGTELLDLVNAEVG
jgi:hypothetical protein